MARYLLKSNKYIGFINVIFACLHSRGTGKSPSWSSLTKNKRMFLTSDFANFTIQWKKRSIFITSSRGNFDFRSNSRSKYWTKISSWACLKTTKRKKIPPFGKESTDIFLLNYILVPLKYRQEHTFILQRIGVRSGEKTLFDTVPIQELWLATSSIIHQSTLQKLT